MQSPKTELSKTLSRVDAFEDVVFLAVVVWTEKTKLFENLEVTKVSVFKEKLAD